MAQFAVALAAASILAIGASATAQIRCPAELSISEQPVAPPGMRGEGAQRTRPLQRVAIFDGVPSEKKELKPSRTSREGGLTVQVFDLPTPRLRPTIIVCRYADTPATLSAPIPTTVKRCVLRFAGSAQAGKARPQSECS